MWIAVVIYGLSALFVAASVCYRWIRRKELAAVANMSSPPAFPLIGHLYFLKFVSPEQLYSQFSKLVASYPSPMVCHMGPYIHVVLTKPEEFQIVMNSPHCLDKSMQYEFLRVSKSFFAAPAHVWKVQRKNLTVSFGSRLLSDFVPIFNEKSAILTRVLDRYVDGKEHDMRREIAKCFLATIYSTEFGQTQLSDGDLYLDAQNEFLELIAKRMFTPSYYFEWLYRLTKDYKREQEILRYARDITKRIVEKRSADVQHVDKTNRENPAESPIDGRKPQIFLDKLLELAHEEHLVKKGDIPEHMDTIIIAGSHSTATTMANLFLMLAMHPDVQERVYQEVMEVCPDKDQSVSIEDTAKLTYTEMVCKETMRLFPVVPVLARSTEQDVKLDKRNTIPANATIICLVYQTHIDPQIWGPKANEFYPDHFLPDNISKIHPYAYLPFSGGARNCLGIRYALISMKIMIVHILRKYRLKTSLTMDKLCLTFSLFLSISNGCIVSLEERK